MIFVPEGVGQIELADQALPAEQLSGIPVSRRIPVLQQKDPVGDRPGQLRLVQGHDHRRLSFPAQTVQQFEKGVFVMQIEEGRRLVQKEHLRLPADRPGQKDPLALPVAELTEAGKTNDCIGTVEAEPSIEDVVAAAKAGGYTRVVLEPLMVVAGDHANNDMAGDEEDSWKTILQNEGFEVVPVLRGLGQIEGVRAVYVDHVKNAK